MVAHSPPGIATGRTGSSGIHQGNIDRAATSYRDIVLRITDQHQFIVFTTDTTSIISGKGSHRI